MVAITVMTAVRTQRVAFSVRFLVALCKEWRPTGFGFATSCVFGRAQANAFPTRGSWGYRFPELPDVDCLASCPMRYER